MRCRECNVDLSEIYTRCPLCGAEAHNDEGIIKGITPAPYPHSNPATKVPEEKKVRTPFTVEKIKAFFNL